MLAQMWVANPMDSERWTTSLGGVDLDPEIWEVRIHLDGVDNLERTIARDDITYMNIVAIIEEKGFSIRDSIYCRKQGVDQLVENNYHIYELLDHFDARKVLSLFVKRGKVSKNKKSVAIPSQPTSSSIVQYEEPVPIDCNAPVPIDYSEPVYVVDKEGYIFTSQTGSTVIVDDVCTNTYLPTQESQMLLKGKAIAIEETDSEDDCSMGSDIADDDPWWDAAIEQLEESRRKEQMELAERIEELRRKRQDPLLHYEGDTDIEDLFVTEEDTPTVFVPAPEPAKKKKKIPVKKGPTSRCHTSVAIQDAPEYIPSSDDEDNAAGFSEDDEVDLFEPLIMVPPKGRKNRSKKRPERRWNYSYWRNSNVRIIVHCIHKDCAFHMTASEIKGEKTFCIRTVMFQVDLLLHTRGLEHGAT
uniref:Uncharacterized protein n=1 Tax=Avena sativa TaxID=4498 RepID=A0ACD5ZIR3_AVESA